jgi:hypothetical protein
MPKKPASHGSNKKSKSKPHGGGKPKKEGAAKKKGGSRSNSQGKKIGTGILTKGGCLPKLFVLLLPFIAIGASFFIRS